MNVSEELLASLIEFGIVGGTSYLVLPSVRWVIEQLNNVHEVRAAQLAESRKPVTISKHVAPKPICNICTFPYTETGIHTPRMLRACGHTICEQCASKLLSAKFQNLLVCPFCQKKTVVNGPAGNLPKNFALLEYRREVVQQ